MKPLDRCRVLVTPTSYASQDESLKTRLEAGVAEVVYNTSGKPLSSEDLRAKLPGIDGMIAGLDELDERAFQAADALKVVARYGVGVNNVDLEAAKRRGIVVTTTPAANAKAVAELAVALILNLLRPVIDANQRTKAGDWPRLKGTSLEGKTVGLYGLGAIGKEVAHRLSGFECVVLATDLRQDDSFAAKHGVEFVSAEELLQRADVLSLHVPGTPDTRGMVNSEFLGRMKAGAWLVNTARGDLIDELALAESLDTGRLRGAALDVFAEEPPPSDGPLMRLDDVILTPHMGSHTDSSVNRMGQMALEECLRVLGGEEPLYRVA